MDIIVVLLTAALAYLLGSIPTGYLAGKWMGVDIRASGSGNIGATNAFRILGKTAGTVVLVVDGLKGWLAAAVVPDVLFHWLGKAAATEPTPEYLCILAGVIAVLGHNYTCWLKFKGGKGIATSAGVLAALVPWTFVVALSVWILFCVITRYVSVASIAAALVLPLATWLFHYSGMMIAITGLLGVMATYKHKANIVRLMNGTENKLGRKKTPAPTGVAS